MIYSATYKQDNDLFKIRDSEGSMVYLGLVTAALGTVALESAISVCLLLYDSSHSADFPQIIVYCKVL